MNNVVLCPNCGGQKTVPKPPYIVGDANSWVSSSMEAFSCPACDGRGWIRVDSVTQDDFDCIKSIALSSMETAENLMDECTKRADKIKELEAQVHSLTEQRDRFARVNTRLMQKEDEQYDALCEHVAYTHLIESERDSTIRYLTKEHNNDIKELETRCNTLNKACERREISILKESDKLATKNILLGNMLLQNESEIKRLESSYRSALIAISVTERSLECRDGMVARLETVNKELKTALGHMADGEHEADKEIERLRTKIFDIDGREDLVTMELEHRACVAEEQLCVVKEMRDELLEEWEKKRGEVARLKTVVHELEAAIVGFKSAENGFRALVDNKDLRIADLESRREMVRKTHDAKEEELLGIINDLTNENHGLENVVDTCTAAIRDLGCVCNRDSGDLEMLDSILGIVNPLIKSGAYAKPSANSRLLSIRMHELCQTVVQFRRKHNIVG